jgi:hypothetical protein
MHRSKEVVSMFHIFEQEDSEYEADLEQQQECEYMSDWELDSPSVCRCSYGQVCMSS